MDLHVLLALGVTVAAGTGFAANEWSHGGMSEAMGWGHRHMLDDSAWHEPCAHAGHHDEAAHHGHAACGGGAEASA